MADAKPIRGAVPRSAWFVSGLQVLVLAIVLAAWQWLPQIIALRNLSVVFDPFFVSSPSRILETSRDLVLGQRVGIDLWGSMWRTLLATFIGVAAGTVAGGAGGLVLSNNDTAQRTLAPFIAFLNSMPRIALVPIFIILVGPTTTASALTTVVVVFFLVFYNAFAGGRSVPASTVESAQLLGASRREVMMRVRLPYVLAWTLTSLPNALSFGLVAVVTAEILSGQNGMGALLLQSISAVDSTLTFTVVVMLSVVGAVMVLGADLVQKRALHWWHVD